MTKDITDINKLALTIVLISLMLYVQSAGALDHQTPSPLIPFSAFDPGRIKEKTQKKTKGLIKPEKILVQKEKPLLKPQENVAAIKFKLSDLVVTGVTAYKKGELLRYYKPYLGKDVSLTDLQGIADAITERYRNDGYVLSRAIVPAQQIEAGKVSIQAIEGYISAVYVEGEITNKTRSRVEKYGEKIKQMRPLQVRKLEHYVISLNDISGLVVKTVLSPAVAVVGASELTFVVEQERITLDAYSDNRGSRYLGPEEVVASVSLHDAIFAADDLMLQTIDTPTYEELRYLKLIYDFPLGISDFRLNVSGDYTETQPGFIIDSFGLIGRAKSWSAGIEYLLLRTRTKKLSVYGKFDWADSYTNDSSVNDILYQDHIRSARFGAAYNFADQLLGTNVISVDFSKGLHIFGASPDNPQILLSRTGARSDYKKVDINISRYQSFGSRWMLVFANTGQYSFHNGLLSAEQFAFGGAQFGHAFDPSEIIGDSGIASKLELHVDTYPDKRFLQEIQYYTFYEIGATWNTLPDLVQPNKDSGADLGAGLRANFNKYFYGTLEIAKPLTRTVATQITLGKNGKAWRLYFSIGTRL